MYQLYYFLWLLNQTLQMGDAFVFPSHRLQLNVYACRSGIRNLHSCDHSFFQPTQGCQGWDVPTADVRSRVSVKEHAKALRDPNWSSLNKSFHLLPVAITCPARLKTSTYTIHVERNIVVLLHDFVDGNQIHWKVKAPQAPLDCTRDKLLTVDD